MVLISGVVRAISFMLAPRGVAEFAATREARSSC